MQSPPSCPTFIETIVGHDMSNTSMQADLPSPLPWLEKGGLGKIFCQRKELPVTMLPSGLMENTPLFMVIPLLPIKSFNKYVVQSVRWLECADD